MTTLPVFGSLSGACVSSGNNNPQPPLPSGISAGDLIVAFAESNSTSNTWPTVPATYTIGPLNTPTTGVQVYGRIATVGESGSESWVRGTTTGNGGVLLMRFLAGTFDSSNPLAAVASVASTATTAITLPTVTATTPNSLLVEAILSTSIVAQTWTPPGSATHVTTGTTGGSAACPYAYADEVLAAAGATGTRAWSHTGSIAQRGAMIVINPAPDAGAADTLKANVAGVLTTGTPKANVAGVLTAGTPKANVAGVLT